MPFAIAPDGARLFYQATSLVPPWRKKAGVVLMHHGVGLNGDAWMDWQPTLLAADYRVIRIDLAASVDRKYPLRDTNGRCRTSFPI
jgi:3-oxoadipate enol-lactonase